eukprot:CAMPEP_0206586436 /NCGR_PEP_ID=MMETSP0325_2-20121206/37021_1 /ASSEMBLY_ACC=CAM_ASM_000347 /TAXON_ID=2866 /ORGANISM="Crypthecodinium cohnii, Strain Seligo" /LENGTH=109 /DNA_ID=CAMNT_0054094193 /DNA_START=77 /DNA_END=407 /DNA_ORIENTATION=-
MTALHQLLGLRGGSAVTAAYGSEPLGCGVAAAAAAAVDGAAAAGLFAVGSDLTGLVGKAPSENSATALKLVTLGTDFLQAEWRCAVVVAKARSVAWALKSFAFKSSLRK